MTSHRQVKVIPLLKNNEKNILLLLLHARVVTLTENLFLLKTKNRIVCKDPTKWKPKPQSIRPLQLFWGFMNKIFIPRSSPFIIIIITQLFCDAQVCANECTYVFFMALSKENCTSAQTQA